MSRVSGTTLDLNGLAGITDSYFVAVKDGDYAEIWGMAGIVPYLSKLVTRLV
jgi:hypothetical protein